MNDFSQLLSLFATPKTLAPEFDPILYRMLNADLASMSDRQAFQHFEKYGQSEGRCASVAAHRAGFVAQIPRDRPTLEIGPAVRPALSGPHVRYFEIESREGLIERAKREGYAYDKCPSVIHYVSLAGDFGVVDRKFETVFSSHCIEHQPDLIRHLVDVGNVLMPGGRYFLLIPDKRYCFDALLPESTLEEIVQAHSELRRTHTFEKVLEHYADTTHNDTARHWQGIHIDEAWEQTKPARIELAKTVFAQADNSYADVHAWQFTPDSFRRIIAGLRSQIELVVERVYFTVNGQNEFGAVLVRR